jgi:hypothetical protein
VIRQRSRDQNNSLVPFLGVTLLDFTAKYSKLAQHHDSIEDEFNKRTSFMCIVPLVPKYRMISKTPLTALLFQFSSPCLFAIYSAAATARAIFNVSIFKSGNYYRNTRRTVNAQPAVTDNLLDLSLLLQVRESLAC